MEKRIKDLLLTRLLTTQELSEYSGLSEEAIQKRLERGKIDGVLKGRTYLFDRKDFVPAPSRAWSEGQAGGQAPEGEKEGAGRDATTGGAREGLPEEATDSNLG